MTIGEALEGVPMDFICLPESVLRLSQRASAEIGEVLLGGPHKTSLLLPVPVVSPAVQRSSLLCSAGRKNQVVRRPEMESGLSKCLQK
jgi:hypothetical protein